ncbi:hypothetical protein HOY80DRAFT_1106495 [Tuber brumale]|nr:hypothetical protein HOY80DRAFT_1106495 [Tuber brumale]
MLGNTNSHFRSGSSRGSGVDTHNVPLRSVADLPKTVRIDTRKVKEEEEPSSTTGGGNSDGDDAGWGQPGLAQNSLSFMQWNRLVIEVPRLRSRLRASIGMLPANPVVELSTGATTATAPTCLNASCALEEISRWKSNSYSTTGIRLSYSFAHVVTAELNKWLSDSLAKSLLIVLPSKQTVEETNAFLSPPPHQTI